MNVLTMLLGVSGIEIRPDENKNRVFYTEKDEEGKKLKPVTSDELAAGYRALIGMIGDMLISFYDMAENSSVIDPKDLKGMCIIDELELHFHPIWQKKVPTLFSTIFPQVQFIVSTHSPIPLLGAPPGSVFLKIDRSSADGITVEHLEHIENEISNLLPNTILSSPVFDFQDIFPVTHGEKNRIRTEDTYNEILINEKLLKRLRSFKGSDLERELIDYLRKEHEKK